MSRRNKAGLSRGTGRAVAGVLAAGLSALALSACSAGDKAGRAAATPPNIVFILADDMGASTPGVYGGKVIKTPNIDRLAREGMRFTQAYSASAVCAPARASLLTGLHSGHTSVRGNTGGIALADGDVTFAEVLKARGYKVGGFGKWGLGDLGTEGVPEKQGFDRFYGYYHQIHAHFFYTDYLIENSRKIPIPTNATPERAYTPTLTTAAMKDFIRANKDRPFFAFGSWILPHTNDDDKPEIPETDPAYRLYKDSGLPEAARKFAAMNTRLDTDLGEIVSLLEELGIAENTIVIFASDNGPGTTFEPYFNTNGALRGNKESFYEGGIRTPLIVKWPGRIAPNSVSDLQVYFPDFMPTFADMAAAQTHLPANLDGISFFKTLTGQPRQERHRFLYWEMPNYDWTNNVYYKNGLQQAIRRGNWKLVRHRQDQPWELYNLADDPNETTNLAARYPRHVADLAALAASNRKPMPAQIEPEMPEGKWYR
jgi:arylsulfatase A-like enzyme